MAAITLRSKKSALSKEIEDRKYHGRNTFTVSYAGMTYTRFSECKSVYSLIVVTEIGELFGLVFVH
jgi:hypothetical protein